MLVEEKQADIQKWSIRLTHWHFPKPHSFPAMAKKPPQGCRFDDKDDKPPEILLVEIWTSTEKLLQRNRANQSTKNLW